MNFRGKIENLFNKNQNSDEELAVIFKNCEEKDGSIVYLPVGVVSGKLDEETLSFTSGDVTFNHLIKGPKEYGFAFSKTLTETVKENKLIPKVIQIKLMLRSLRNFNYIYAKDQHKNPIVGVQSSDNTSDIDILYEDELLNYYIKNFPTAKEIIDLLKKASGRLYLDIKEISKALEESFTNSKQSKEILTSIWKHTHSNKPYNIFINGSDITPKKDIIKKICTISNMACYYVSAIDNYEIFDVQDILKSLLEAFDNNLQLAEHSILIIDNIDKLALNDLSTDAFANAQYNLAKLLRGETIELEYNRFKKVNFNTSKMMIIGMGNFKNREYEDFKVSGFSNSKEKKNTDAKDKYRYGMLDGLFDYFKRIIQMDEPLEEDYRLLLMERENAGILSNADFFNSFNIKLTFKKEVINRIAKEAYEKRMSQTDIRDYIENLLSKASYEISMHPNLYKELVITPETITDNKVYKLVKRSTNN